MIALGRRRALRCALLGVLTALAGACFHPMTATPPPPPPPAMAPIRAMTFNIRLDLASDGANAWPHRRGMVAALLSSEAADLLGLQEVLLGQKRDLEAALPAYAMVGVARGDGREEGEFSPLAYRSERFEMLRSGTFWLSPTPDRPSTGWDAALPRIATWAILRDRGSGARIRVLNTHFDHVGAQARARSAAQILRWIEQGAGSGLPTVVMGDLNSTPGSEPYRLLAGPASGLRDTRIASETPPRGPPGTFTGFDLAAAPAAPIDHIFVTGEFTVASHAVIARHWGDRLPSDHYPVLAVLRLAPRAD